MYARCYVSQTLSRQACVLETCCPGMHAWCSWWLATCGVVGGQLTLLVVAVAPNAGLKGICGNSDVRAVVDGAQKGDAHSQLALDMFVYRCVCGGGRPRISCSCHVAHLLTQAACKPYSLCP